MILAGDIGGTKTNLALFEAKKGKLQVVVQKQFASQTFATFSEVIEAFKKECVLTTIDAACFGIAGPIIGGDCETTNLPWKISTLLLHDFLGIKKVRLLNDLEATAYGMLYVPQEEFVDLNPSAQTLRGNRAVIAAGTGLGEGILYDDGARYHPIGSEGGHSDFAPLTPQQDALLLWLRMRYPEHVSYERILSGPGISTLYAFLLERGFAPQPPSMLHLKEGEDRSAIISQCALNDSDPLCVETLSLFAQIYGAEAGNLALKSMSLGGVYIGGGIAPKILPMLRESHFMDAFVSKGRFEKMLRKMPVRVCLNPQTALLGAAYFAHDML